MKRVLFILICLSFVGCASTFKTSNGEDGKPGVDGKPGTEQKGADGKHGEDGKNKSFVTSLKS